MKTENESATATQSSPQQDLARIVKETLDALDAKQRKKPAAEERMRKQLGKLSAG